MSYPGNPSLAQETQDRLLSTFSQTLDLAARGNREEALLGCDFILRMDPLFEPARRLLERLQAASGAVDASDLQLDAMGEELSFASLEAFDSRGSEYAVRAAGEGLKAELDQALRERRLGDVVDLAEREPEAVAADPELGRLVEAARSGLEAEPYVTRFLQQAREALEIGQSEEAAKLLAKARALDAEHPGIAELERLGEGDAALDGGLLADPSLAGAPSLGQPSPDAGDQRIADLLEEGQAAFDRGEHQAAIDAWSRIFLIDIDHAEAAARIDQARSLKAEAERKVEEIFHEAMAHFDAGERDQAGAAFRRVLEMQPNHLAAREYLEQLAAAPAAEHATAAPAAAPAGGRQRPQAEILVPLDPAVAAAKRRPEPATPIPRAAAKAAPRRAFVTIGSAVLAVLVAGGALVWLNRERLFPNSSPAAPPSAVAEPDPLTRATELHGQGKTAAAVAQLRRLPPEDPQYDRAQALIQQWEAAGKPAPAGPSTEDLTRRAGLIERARQAYAQREYLLADSLFAEAAAIATLDGTAGDLAQDVRRQIAPLEEQIRLYRQGEWAAAVPSLWRIRNREPENRDVARLIVDSYYNLGVRELQRELPGDAAAHFKEALTLAPADPDLRRLAQFADAYSGRQQDLLYRTFVKYLPFRS